MAWSVTTGLGRDKVRIKHFFQATQSLTSFFYVAKRLLNHIKELALYQRAIQVTSGNALAARLAKSALDLGIPILTSTPAKGVVMEDTRVVGMQVDGQGGERILRARHGVVLACGGFPQDVKRIAQAGCMALYCQTGAAIPHIADSLSQRVVWGA